MGYFVFFILALVVLFIVTHFRPLTKKEVENLSEKKRKREIKDYFTFDQSEYVVDKTFKKSMSPNGKLYHASERLHAFPSIAAGLLKYKKHEWIIVAFEENKSITAYWLNKGFDKSEVGSYLSSKEMLDIAQNKNSSTVLVFHNHPNSNPNQYRFNQPSEQDIVSANFFSDALCLNGVNLIEFVCERGRHYQYYEKFSTSFFPVYIFIEAVNMQNGISKWSNLKLHLSRFF